jgi:DNA-binding transcriptional MerR regulator
MVVPVSDVARAFGVDEKTIRRWEASGEIPKAGRTPRGNARRWDTAKLAPVLIERGYSVPEGWSAAVAA